MADMETYKKQKTAHNPGVTAAQPTKITPNRTTSFKSNTPNVTAAQPKIVPSTPTTVAPVQQQKTAYQMNLYQQRPQQPVTTGSVLGRIATIGKTDLSQATQLMNQFMYVQSLPSSGSLYNPFTKPTNRALDMLSQFGFDVSNVDDKWFEDNAWLKQYYNYTANTNGLSSTMTNKKKSSAYEQAAYYYDQAYKAHKDTNNAKLQSSALAEEIKYLVSDPRHYSDQEIKDKIKEELESKYPMIYKMRDSADKGQPVELNSPISLWSDDSFDAAIWMARNPDYSTIDMYGAMALSSLGIGNQFVPNEEIAARRNWNDEEHYAPYSFGSTLTEACKYFGVSGFNDQILSDLRKTIDPKDATAMKYFNDAVEAVKFTKTAKEQLNEMYADIDGMINDQFFNTPEDILKALKDGTHDYSALWKLDEKQDPKDLQGTSEAINYRWRDIERYVRNKFKQNEERKSINDLITSIAQSPETKETESPSAVEEKAEAPVEFKPDVQEMTTPPPPSIEESEQPEPTPTPGPVPGPAPDATPGPQPTISPENQAVPRPAETPTPPPTETQMPQPTLSPENQAIARPAETPTPPAETKGPQPTLSPENQAVARPSETPAPPRQTSIPEPTPTPPPVLSEKDIANDEAFKEAVGKLGKTIGEIGTAAEKAAYASGKTTLFAKGVEALKNMTGNFVQIFENQTTGNIVNQYVDSLRIVRDYESHSDSLAARQSALEDIMPEWESLTDKQRQTAAVAGLEPEQFQRLIEFANDKDNYGWNAIKLEMELGPGADSYDYDFRLLGYDTAVRDFYYLVTGEFPLESGENDEEVYDKVNLWWNYLNRKTPLDQIVRDANKSESDVDDIEIEQDNMLIRLEKGDDGRFAFESAVDTKTGKAYGADRFAEVNELLGYSDMSVEDDARLEELNRMKSALEQGIDEDSQYLKLNEGIYSDAKMDSDQMKFASIAANTITGGRANLTGGIEYLYDVSQNPIQNEIAPYSIYDVSVESGEYTREEVCQIADANARNALEQADLLEKELKRTTELGVPFSDEEKKNIESSISSLRASAKEASFATLDDNENFDKIAEETDQKVRNHEIDIDLSMMLETAMTGKSVTDVRLNKIGNALGGTVGKLIGLKDSVDTVLSGAVLEDQEWKRFYYLLGTDGKEAAQNYLNFLLNPDDGMVTMRRSLDKATWTKQYARENPIMGFVIGRASKFISSPMSFGYRMARKITGKNVNPYDRAYDAQNIHAAADIGAKETISNALGGDESILGRYAGIAYDVIASIVEYAGYSKLANVALEDIATLTNLGKFGQWKNKTIGNVNRTANQAAEKAYLAGSSIGMEGEELYSAVSNAAKEAVKATKAGKKLGILNVVEKGAVNVANVFGMSWDSAEQKYRSVLMETNDEVKAEQASAVSFATGLLTHSVIMNGLGKALKTEPETVSNFISDFVGKVIKTDISVGASTLASEEIKKYTDNAIFGADSEYNKLVKKYEDQYYSHEIAVKMANDEMKEIIFGRVIDSIVSSTLRTTIATVAGAGINAIKKYASSRNATSEEPAAEYTESETKGLPSATPLLPGATDEGVSGESGIPSAIAEQESKEQTIISSVYDAKPETAAVGIATLIDSNDQNADRAAAQTIISDLSGGNTKVAAFTLQQLLSMPSHDTQGLMSDIARASLTGGAGYQALQAVFNKVKNGEALTQADADAIRNGLRQDYERNPEAMEDGYQNAVKENRVANRTNEIASRPENREKIESAEKEAENANNKLTQAQEYARKKQDELMAIAGNMQRAVARSDPKEVQHQTEKTLGADTAAQQAEESVAIQQQKVNQAQKDLKETRSEVYNNARQEASVQTEQEMADEQTQRDLQAQAAAEAERQRQDLIRQKGETEQAKRNTYLEKVKNALTKIGIVGDINKQAERVVERKMMIDRGEVNTDARISEEDGEDFLKAISWQTGMTFSHKKLGDPLIFRGYINDKNDIVLNSNLSKGQALVEAALHETMHGLEDTGVYLPFSEVALKILFGKDTDALNNAIITKINDYASMGKKLTPDGAKREIVADYCRLHMATKKFVRKVVARGVGSEAKNAIGRSVALLKGYNFKGSVKRQANLFQKAERMYIEAIDERARMVKEGYKGHTGITQFSITSAAQSVGLTVEVTDDDDYRYKLYDSNGNELAPGEFTPDMVKGTPAGKVIDLAMKYSTAPDREKTAETQRKFVSDIINMIGQYQDAAMVWELAGSLAFSTLKTNGDPQYTDSDDMGTICTKTQAILNVISDVQVRLGRGLTKKEIDGVVYNEVGKGVQDKNGKWIHGATPCPPCYVYATWVNKPARLEMIRKYQEKCKDWTDEQINEFMNAPAPASKKAATERNRLKLWINTCLADEHKDPETGESTWTRKENPSICPNEILLDLRRSGDMATQYPGTWKFMQKGGNAQGKAIAPYSDSRIGETIVGKAIGASELNSRLLEDSQNAGNPDYIPRFVNPFLTGDDEKAEEYFQKALAKAKAQNLKGGQRWQSWSDARAEWGSDYLMEMLTMQALGAKVQTYTKVPEMLPLLASAGFEVNMSLMPEGDGFAHNDDGSIKMDEDGNPVLAFSRVTGINPEAAEAFAKQYGEKGNVQPMVVGISDEHIKAALAGDYITFVIPFHGSGGSVKRLQHLMALLKERMNSGNDYTKAQSDKFLTGDENTNPNWILREAILTGNYNNLNDQQKAEIDNNPYLLKLYEDRYLNEDSEAYQVFFSRGEAQQIYPYEYWDTNTTLADADKNSRRFIEYCSMLGVIPRFSGLQKKNGTEYANFSGAKRDENGNIIGYDPVPGYWKLLIDRPMYKRIYDRNGKLMKDQCTYRDPEVVNVGNIEVTAMPMAANNTVGHSDDETREIADRVIQQNLLNKGPATNAALNMTLGNTPSEYQEDQAIIKKAMYADSDVQLSAGINMSDDEIDQFIERIDADQTVNNMDIGTVEDSVGINISDQPLNERYLELINSGREEEAIQMLKEKAEKANGIVLCRTTKKYQGGNIRIAKNIKKPFEHPDDVEKAAKEMSIYMPSNAVLIPMPPHTGIVDETTDTFILAKKIAELTGTEVLTALGSDKHVSSYFSKTEYGKPVFSSEIGMRQIKDIPEGKIPIVIDNVISTGNTAKAAYDALGRDDAIIFAYAKGQSKNLAGPLKNLSITKDSDGNIIPYDQRMDVNNPDYDYSIGGELSDTEIDELLVRTGLITPEMIPYSYMPSTNVMTGGGEKQRQFGSKTAQESDALHEEVKQYLFRNSGYIPETNDQQIRDALDWVQKKATMDDPDGYQAALDEVTSEDFDYMSAEGQARMLTVMGMAAVKAEGGSERALADEMRLSDAYNRQGTDLGRALQARKIFRLMTPVGRKAVLQREEDRINEMLANKGKKYTVKLPQEILDAAANAKTEEDFYKARQKAAQALNEQLPVNWGDRIVAWRMLSMLSAPKTHIRNVIGNALFVPVVGLKNKVAAGIEIGAQAVGAIGKNQRTKTIGFANPKARQFAKNDAKEVEDLLRGNAKYKEGNLMQQEKKYFGTKNGPISKTFGKALQKWYDFNGKALEFEDWLFLKGHYTRALSGYMTARGLKPEDMKGKVLEEARAYAIEEAQKATYRDQSAIADKMNKIRIKGKTEDDVPSLAVAQWFINTILPFKKTPINIAKRGIEYSPVGLGKNVTLDALHLKQYLDYKNGNLKKKPKSAITPTEFIDKFAAGLTGTGIMIAGFVAAALGLARAGFINNDPEDEIAKMAGEQEFAIKPGKTGLVKWLNNTVTNIGKNFDPEFEFELLGEDVSMSLDWAAPVCLPFFTGVALNEQTTKGGLNVGNAFDAVMEITDPMMNMTLMEGVSNLFKTNTYSGKDSIWQIGEKTILNWVSSLVPTWLGQVAKTVDPTRRGTYIESGTGDADLERTIQQIKNKIPWVSMSGVPYTNELGETQENVIAPWVENILSPAYFSKVDTSEEFEEMKRLYNVTKNKKIIPSTPQKTISINGETIPLNAEQYNQIKEDHGSVWRDTVQKLINNPLYLSASEDSKAEMWDLADSYATQIAKHNLDSRYKVKPWAEEALKKGNADEAIIKQVADANKSYYVKDKATTFAEALFSGNNDDIKLYAQELREAEADPSDVRKKLTEYFKPLYKQAYEDGDSTTIKQIETILTNVNRYLQFEKPVTKYTQRDFNQWIGKKKRSGQSGELVGYVAGAMGAPSRRYPAGMVEESKNYYPSDYNGNVDLADRKIVPIERIQEAGWGVSGDSYGTIFSSTFSAGDTSNGYDFDYERNVTLDITPILEDGTVLSQGELEDYIDSISREAKRTGETLMDVDKRRDRLLLRETPVTGSLDDAYREAEEWTLRLHETQAEWDERRAENGWLNENNDEDNIFGSW